jgi:hypothetical protein
MFFRLRSITGTALCAGLFLLSCDNPADDDGSAVPLLNDDIGAVSVQPLSSINIALARDSAATLTYELLQAPARAEIANGRFEWTPGYFSLGKQCSVSVLARNSRNVTDTTTFTVTVEFSAAQKDSIAALVPEGDCFVLLNPHPGDIFDYGDTLPIVFIHHTGRCNQAVPQMSSDEVVFVDLVSDFNDFDKNDPPYADTDARSCYALTESARLDIFRQVLIDTTFGLRSIRFGGTNMFVQIQDYYAPLEYNGFAWMEDPFTINRD